SLRTSFSIEDDQPVQVIAEPDSAAVTIPIVDISLLEQTPRDQEANRLIMAEAREPFDLAAGPLLRAGLIRMQEQEHIVLFTMHHIISDAWSMSVLVREVTALYDAYLRGEEPRLEELALQYADYAVWQRSYLQGEVFEEQLDYWKQQLADRAPVLELPSDRARPAVQSYRGSYDTEVIGDGISEGLKGLSQREGTTLFMTMLAVFKVLLYRYSGQTDISIGTPIANRNRVETEGLIGFFVNTVVMRNDLSGEPSFKELLGRVKEAALGAYAHQDLPFEKLVEVLQPERDLSHSPLFQVMFSFQNAPKETLQMRDLKFQIFYSDTGTARFDWQVYVVERPGTLAITFEYNTDLFELETIKRAQQHLRRLIESVLKDPEKKISKLEMMSEDERRQVLVEWNRTETEYGERSVQEMFEQEAESRPW